MLKFKSKREASEWKRQYQSIYYEHTGNKFYTKNPLHSRGYVGIEVRFYAHHSHGLNVRGLFKSKIEECPLLFNNIPKIELDYKDLEISKSWNLERNQLSIGFNPRQIIELLENHQITRDDLEFLIFEVEVGAAFSREYSFYYKDKSEQEFEDQAIKDFQNQLPKACYNMKPMLLALRDTDRVALFKTPDRNKDGEKKSYTYMEIWHNHCHLLPKASKGELRQCNYDQMNSDEKEFVNHVTNIVSKTYDIDKTKSSIVRYGNRIFSIAFKVNVESNPNILVLADDSAMYNHHSYDVSFNALTKAMYSQHAVLKAELGSLKEHNKISDSFIYEALIGQIKTSCFNTLSRITECKYQGRENILNLKGYRSIDYNLANHGIAIPMREDVKDDFIEEVVKKVCFFSLSNKSASTMYLAPYQREGYQNYKVIEIEGNNAVLGFKHQPTLNKKLLATDNYNPLVDLKNSGMLFDLEYNISYLPDLWSITHYIINYLVKPISLKDFKKILKKVSNQFNITNVDIIKEFNIGNVNAGLMYKAMYWLCMLEILKDQNIKPISVSRLINDVEYFEDVINLPRNSSDLEIYALSETSSEKRKEFIKAAFEKEQESLKAEYEKYIVHARIKIFNEVVRLQAKNDYNSRYNDPVLIFTNGKNLEKLDGKYKITEELEKAYQVYLNKFGYLLKGDYDLETLINTHYTNTHNPLLDHNESYTDLSEGIRFHIDYENKRAVTSKGIIVTFDKLREHIKNFSQNQPIVTTYGVGKIENNYIAIGCHLIHSSQIKHLYDNIPDVQNVEIDWSLYETKFPIPTVMTLEEYIKKNSKYAKLL